jgi:hypothetical protein
MTKLPPSYHLVEVEQYGPFLGIGGLYRLVRFQQGGRTKIELYRVDPTGLELFIGYVPRSAWDRRHPCDRCAANAHQPCWAVGAVVPPGNLMQTVHANRRRSR